MWGRGRRKDNKECSDPVSKKTTAPPKRGRKYFWEGKETTGKP